MIDWNALYKVSLGLYVLGTNDKQRFVGSVIDAVMVAANQPCSLIISCHNASFTKKCLEENGEFSLSVLPFNIEPTIIANFGFQSSENINKWENVNYKVVDGLPFLENATAIIKAKVIQKYILQSNTIFIAEVIFAQNNSSERPLLYEDYRSNLREKVIQSFQKNFEEKKMENEKEKKWVCTVCNYVYDGEVEFEKLNDDYICPICGVDKSYFELKEV